MKGRGGATARAARTSLRRQLRRAITLAAGGTSTFTARPGRGAKPPDAPGPLRGLRILLVEDHELNQQVALELLGSVAGAEVAVAGDGCQALALLAERPFDAVLMDVQMPGMDGLEATRRLRAMPGLESLPVIAMTAHALVQEREACLAAGMDDFISKPFELEHLVQLLARWTTRGPAHLTIGRSAGRGTDLPGIQAEVGLAFCAGQEDVFLLMLQRFRQAKARDGEDMGRALRTGDLEQARRLAHTMKSTAMAIGAVALAAAARDLEAALAESRDPGDLVIRFQTSLQQVLESLDRGFPAGGKDGPGAGAERPLPG